MSLVAMKTGIHPLCNIHFCRMQQVILYWSVPGLSESNITLAFACEDLNCNQLYDIGNGYHQRPEGKIQREEKQCLCRKDNLPMFITRHNPQGSVKEYLCSQMNCGGGKEVRGDP